MTQSIRGTTQGARGTPHGTRGTTHGARGTTQGANGTTQGTITITPPGLSIAGYNVPVQVLRVLCFVRLVVDGTLRCSVPLAIDTRGLLPACQV